MIEKNPRHVLVNARILHDMDLLEKLKNITAVKLSDKMTPTRAPPHMYQFKIV